MSIKATYENGLFQSECQEDEDTLRIVTCKGSDVMGYSVTIKPNRKDTIEYRILVDIPNLFEVTTDIYDEYLAYIEVIKQAMTYEPPMYIPRDQG